MKLRIANNILVAGAFILLVGSSCQKDWLSPAPENQLVSDDTTFNDPNNATRFVNACYTNLLTWEETSFAFVGITSITSDDADKGSSPGDLGSDKDQMDNITYTATSGSVSDFWKGNFHGVAACNVALQNVPKYNIDAALRNRLQGEAKFLRAYYYFNLVRAFGSIPKVDTVLDATNPADLEKANKQVDKSEIYSLIESDLNYALANLPSKGEYSAADLGRATKGAAAALLAKVSMYEKKWDQALTLTDNIINGTYGSYALVPDYTTIWREVGENSSESLFEIQGKGTSPYAGVQQYSAVQGIRGGVFNVPSSQVAGGWGFNTPSADLDNAYEAGDVRRNATIIHVGDVLFDGVKLISAENERYNYKAYVSVLKESYSDADKTNKNVRILRMGEIYLINAEAANELGNTQKALTSLNAVRARARGGNPNVLPDVTSSDQSALRTAIWKERRVELGMEHDRFFDLIRQGRAGTVLRALGKNFVDGKNEVFPIPQSEIDASGGKLIQNPGY